MFLALSAPLLAPSALAQGPNDVPGQGPVEIAVPSAEYPSIQSAIDAVADGGTIRLAPGVYRESLVVADKFVTIEGGGARASMTRIRGEGAASDAPVVDLQGAAGVSLATLTVSHGGYGVRALADSPAAAVHTRDAEIELVGRGVYGSFADLEMIDTTVRNTGWNGVSVLHADRLVFDGLTVRGADGVGLLVLNDTAPATGGLRLVSASTFEHNRGGGVEVHGSALPVRVLNSDFDGNRVAGLTVVDVDDAYLYGLSIDRTESVPGSDTWGDGLRVFGSANVELRGVDVWSSARAGLSAYGCEGDSSRVSLSGVSLDANDIDVIHGAPDGCAASAAVTFEVDEDSVSCDDGACRAEPTGLAPIAPIAAP